MDKPFSIDRFEEDLAVLIAQDGGYFPVSAHKLPTGVREGDLVALRDGKWTVLQAETEKQRQSLFDLQESLFDE
jgi:hypothetical protein